MAYEIIEPKRKLNLGQLLNIFFLLVIIAAIPLTVFVAQQRQEIRQRAAETNNSKPILRNYLLATGTVQAKPVLTSSDQFGITSIAKSSTEVDLINAYVEWWGVPWDIFSNGQTPADNWEWTQRMRTIKANIDANGHGKPVVLNLVLAREQLAKKATVGSNNTLVLTDNWSGTCYNFVLNPSMKTAYTRYVDWMVRLFNPSYVNVAVEINSYLEDCSTRVDSQTSDTLWGSVVDVEKTAYNTVKLFNPSIKTFSSIIISKLYGYGQECTQPMTTTQCDAQRLAHYDLMYPKLADLKRDYFAVSTYPYMDKVYDPATGNHNMKVSEIPSDWFTRAGDRGGERTIISETGWNSTDLVVDNVGNGSSWHVLISTEVDQKAYLDRVLSDAVAKNIDIVTWFANLDILPTDIMIEYQCASNPSYSPIWCPLINSWRKGANPQWMGEALIKIWGTNGIRNYDGSPKTETFITWQSAYNLPYVALTTPTIISTNTPTPTFASPTPFVCTACAADIDKSGRVDNVDYQRLITCLNKKATNNDIYGRSCVQADINGSGMVDAADYNCLAQKFNQTCSTGPTATPFVFPTAGAVTPYPTKTLLK